MKKFKLLVLMQFKDMLGNKASTKKDRMRRLLIEAIKFIAVAAVSFGIFYLLKTFVFSIDELSKVLVLITTFTTLLSTVVATVGLMKSLYFSDDNKVLITLPVPTNMIFMSKIVVFYLYEIKKNLTFFVPMFYACIFVMQLAQNLVSPIVYFWAPVTVAFILMLPVLAGALLSIPLMLIVRFLKRFQFLQVLLAVPLLGAAIMLIVHLIGLIPQNIDLIAQWPSIKASLHDFLLYIEQKFVVFDNMVYGTIGEHGVDLKFHLCGASFARFGILVLICAALFAAAFFISRPLFFGMMSKNFEEGATGRKQRKNVRRNKYFTFIKKEFFITIRSIDVSLNYLIVYIAIPILIMFLNALYHVMDTRQFGNLLIYAFNILLICLPFLASNALVATYYSKEGRAGYLKRTKPIYALYPLFTKLFFNVLFSIPAVLITVFIFGRYSEFTAGESAVLGFAILFLHIAHMFYSAMLDVMNPQNEQYATTGGQIDNPNENKSTLHAFLWSAIFAFVSYILLSEATVGDENSSLLPGLFKLFAIGLACLLAVLVLFVKRIRAFYYDLQG